MESVAPKNRGGFFIAFEGIDGCGKSTALSKIAERITGYSYSLCLTHEPTDGVFGRRIYDILYGRLPMVAPRELQKLYVEDRKNHIKTVISPALEDNKAVLSDRYWLSTVAYGMLSGKMEEFMELHHEVLGENFLKPDVTFLLDLPAEIAAERMSKANKTADFFEKAEKLRKIKENYLAIANAGIDNIRVVNAAASPDALSAEIWEILVKEGFLGL